MKPTFYELLIAALMSVPFQLGGHIILFQADSHYLSSNSSCEVLVYCGTLAESEISLQPDTFQNLNICGPKDIEPIDNQELKPYVTQSIPWRIGQRIRGKFGGFDRRRVTTFNASFKEEGSYVLTAELYPYHMAKTPVSWAEWMEELYMVENKTNEFPTLIGKPSMKGRYHKSIKTFIQIGNEKTKNAVTETNLTTEIIPDINPGSMSTGNRYQFQLITLGTPVPNQLVTIGQRASVFGDENISLKTTDANGYFTVSIDEDGKWFMRAAQIHLRPNEEDIDYEAYIATLSFEVK